MSRLKLDKAAAKQSHPLSCVGESSFISWATPCVPIILVASEWPRWPRHSRRKRPQAYILQIFLDELYLPPQLLSLCLSAAILPPRSLTRQFTISLSPCSSILKVRRRCGGLEGRSDPDATARERQRGRVSAADKKAAADSKRERGDFTHSDPPALAPFSRF